METIDACSAKRRFYADANREVISMRSVADDEGILWVVKCSVLENPDR